MRAVSLTVFVAIFSALFCLSDTVAGQSNPKVEELISLHDLGTTVSIGHYYLKQESLVSIRSYLGQVGHDERLGDRWQPDDRWWQKAEQALLATMMDDIDRDFSDLAWLRPGWAELFANTFSDEEIAALVSHFRTETGGKQVQIIDHTVSTQVMMTLSFAGKLSPMPGIEEDRARMQALWNEEDERMRFSIQGAANGEGQAFALSPLGKRYFTTVILNLTGMVNQRMDEIAVQRVDEVRLHGDSVRPFVEGFKRDSA
ncbi:MAG: hypothetical protein JSU95_12015 [Betaproteobacteria bacterium]|nr:MAG: hypothetical protein JSU95_12015 [Betaproteobacteria bacterium]